jgi:protease IV
MSAIFRSITSVCLVLALASCEGRPRESDPNKGTATRHEPHVAIVDLRQGLPELTHGSIFSGPKPTSVAHLVLALRDLRDDDRAKGVFVRLGTAEIGFARAEEIGRLLGEIRASGRPVVCHADGYGNGSMLLAAQGCDEVWLSPGGMVETVGVAGQLIFGRALLDSLAVQVDFVQAGKYKGAEEPFTRNSASPEARSSVQNALGAVRAAWIDGIAAARNRKADALELESGPHTAKRAKDLGLVDELGVERYARARALERAGVEGDAARFGGSATPDAGLGELLRLLAGGQSSGMPHVALVRATGGITVDESGSLLSGPGGIAERSLTKKLRELEENEAVKAVVLRIDSPGGSALASDLLWQAVRDLRAKKPVVVSVGSMAASGGYYLACAGSKIVVEATSIIGSIGVVGGKLSFRDTLSELGVNVETVPAVEGGSDRALYGSPFSGWNDETRAKMRETVDSHYDLFLERIATGRGISVAEVAPHAEGRLMGGRQAVEAKLADEVGGLGRALDIAFDLAGVDTGTVVQIVDADGVFLDLLRGAPSVAAADGGLANLEERAAARARLASSELLLGPLRRYRPEIAAFTASAAPLLEGEHVLAALPFALAVR